MNEFITGKQLVEATDIIMDGVQKLDFYVLFFCFLMIVAYHVIFHVIKEN